MTITLRSQIYIKKHTKREIITKNRKSMLKNSKRDFSGAEDYCGETEYCQDLQQKE